VPAVAAGTIQRRGQTPWCLPMSAATGLRGCMQRRLSSSCGSWEEAPPEAHILVACNTYKQETVILEQAARRGGFSFRAVGVGEPWRSLGSKLTLWDRALTELVGSGAIPASDPVLLLDACDTMVLGPATELRSKLAGAGAMGLDGLVIGAGDRICAPDYHLAPQVERLFPACQTPWRYPNSGCFAGTGAALREFLRLLVHGSEGGGFTEDTDDQFRVHKLLLALASEGRDFPFVLDEDCTFFQCMGEPECGWDYEPLEGLGLAAKDEGWPRVRNHITGERPLVAHGCGGNGRWFLADVYRELSLLEFHGVEQSDLAEYDYAGLVPPGEKVKDEHWVGLAPWDWTFFNFNRIRTQALLAERESDLDAAANIQVGDTICLQAHTGHYMDVEGEKVAARWQDRSLWQSFFIERLSGDGPVRSGDVIFLRGHTGAHVDVNDGIARARWEDYGTWQGLVIESEIGGSIRSGDTVFLRSHTGCHIHVLGQFVGARWHDKGTWQALRIWKNEGYRQQQRCISSNVTYR